MKTNTIFRIMFMAIMLVVCGNHAKATVFYDNNEGTNYVEFPFGAFDNEAAGSVLRITYVVQPQSGWTPTYKITYGTRQGVIIEETVTEDGTIDIPLTGYNSTNQYNICGYLNGSWVKFKKVETVVAGSVPGTKTDVALSFSPSSLTVGLEESFTAPTLTATANRRTVTGLSYTYSSSNTDVATVDNNGTLTINALGTTTITATFAGNNNYNSATASYSLTVVPSYTITFKLDNEDFDIQHLKAGDVIRPKTPDYRSGFRFGGWENLPYTMPARDLIIYGYYEKIDQYVTLSVGSTGYSTYCPDQPLRFNGTEDIKAYIAKVKSDTEVKLIQVVGTVAPGTGLVLKGWTANVSTNINTAESGDTYSQNLLVGVVGSPAVINNANQYVLVNKDGVAKFADTQYNPAVVPVGKAYLEAPANSRILSFSFDDETTGIEAIHTVKSESQSTEVYNLNGQRINSPKRGLYLMNGKKVVMK